MSGSAGIGRQARLRGVCLNGVGVQVPSSAPIKEQQVTGTF